MKRTRRERARFILARFGSAVTAACALLAPAVAADSDAMIKLGREVFTKVAEPPCGICHTLKDAGTTGTIGANLEELKPDAMRVEEAVRNGMGPMPPYAGKLTEEQIKAEAAYVARAAGK